jgi:hypothetical protein
MLIPAQLQLAAHIISSLERRPHTPAVKSSATAAPCSASRPSYPARPRPAPTNGRPPAAGPFHDAAGDLSRHSFCIRVRLRRSSISRTDPSGPPQQIPMSVTLCPSLPVFVRVERRRPEVAPSPLGACPRELTRQTRAARRLRRMSVQNPNSLRGAPKSLPRPGSKCGPGGDRMRSRKELEPPRTHSGSPLPPLAGEGVAPGRSRGPLESGQRGARPGPCDLGDSHGARSPGRRPSSCGSHSNYRGKLGGPSSRRKARRMGSPPGGLRCRHGSTRAALLRAAVSKVLCYNNIDNIRNYAAGSQFEVTIVAEVSGCNSSRRGTHGASIEAPSSTYETS